MATTLTEPRTHCPNCGVKLPDIPVSLCAYCAMPIDLAESDKDGAEAPNADRIGRIEKHEQFAEAMAWTPPESRPFQMSFRVAYRGHVLLAGAGVIIALAWLIGGSERADGSSAALNGVGIGIALLFAVAGLFYEVKAMSMRKEAVKYPLLKRPGVITDRRSDTTIRGWGGDTCYFFTIEMKDGVVGEFAYPGHGVNEEPYVSNLPGIAFTRGPELLAFKHIRV